jgi:hypothetical protein
MKWKNPPIIKIYEALGAIADNRIEISGNIAKVYSSSGNKFYDVAYDADKKVIMANDNGSYWKGYLGYPSIAFLLKIGLLEFKPELAGLLKEIKWKDINQKFNNDFDKTFKYIESLLDVKARNNLADYVKSIDEKISELNLNLLGEKTIPPKGY